MEEHDFRLVGSLLHQVLLGILEVEKLSHPESYDTAARVGEEMRKTFVNFSGCENLEPIPR